MNSPNLYAVTEQSLRSAIVFDPNSFAYGYNAFSYTLGQPVPGDASQYATYAHTNLYRAGYSGLPLDWSMKVHALRARTNEVLSQPVLDFASTVHVSFNYNMRPVLDGTLLEFLTKPVPAIAEYKDAQPCLWMKEYQAFECRLSLEHQATTEYFASYLHGRKATFWIYLDGFLSRRVV